MSRYVVEITEILQKQIVVDGKNREEAEIKAREKYRNEEVVLSSNDYVDTDFSVLGKEKSKTYDAR